MDCQIFFQSLCSWNLGLTSKDYRYQGFRPSSFQLMSPCGILYINAPLRHICICGIKIRIFPYIESINLHATVVSDHNNEMLRPSLLALIARHCQKITKLSPWIHPEYDINGFQSLNQRMLFSFNFLVKCRNGSTNHWASLDTIQLRS